MQILLSARVVPLDNGTYTILTGTWFWGAYIRHPQSIEGQEISHSRDTRKFKRLTIGCFEDVLLSVSRRNFNSKKGEELLGFVPAGNATSFK